MDTSSNGLGDKSIEMIAKDFARHVHKAWAKSSTTHTDLHSRDSAVLIFVVFELRLIYIARGIALNSVLTDKRILRILSQMYPLLQQAQYESAIIQAIDGMDLFFYCREPHISVASWSRLILPIAFCTVNLYLLWTFRTKEIQHSIFMNHQMMLDEVHAELLSKRFHEDFCPICLEAFHVTDRNGERNLPRTYLRCGHCFCTICWITWSNKRSHEGMVVRCLMCRKIVNRVDCSMSSEKINMVQSSQW